MHKIFVVEDDEDIREIVLYALNSAGFESRGFETGEDFFRACAEDLPLPTLALLDIMLPGDDGLKILGRLKSAARTRDIPVIMLTARGGEHDKVKGLDMGADDYVVKPFGVMELLSRVNAVLRRTHAASDTEKFEISGISLIPARREVTSGGRAIDLTYKEYELLHYLMRNTGIVLSRDKLMETVWGYDFEGESRTVDMHIKSLRQKLGSPGGAIKTVRGVGYKLVDGPEGDL